VIAGLAAGIDTAAHKAALVRGGRTVAIIGTGIRKQYPAENRQLHEEITGTGLLLSQFWPDAPPTRWSFPMRNATMSAYGYATVVVEAGEKSGTRIQAREAVAHGRPVILSSVVARGTSWGRDLVAQPGVYVAETPEQVMDQLDAILAVEERVSQLLAASPARA
jgi:DNA processing protein